MIAEIQENSFKNFVSYLKRLPTIIYTILYHTTLDYQHLMTHISVIHSVRQLNIDIVRLLQ